MIHKPWAVLIAVILPWFIVTLILFGPSLLPTSYWVTFLEFNIEDGLEGSKPVVRFRRQIHHAFTATWVAQVRKRVGNTGVYFNTCSGYGVGDYAPNVVPPAVLSMQWLTNATDCNLKEGEYFMAIAWNLNLPFGSRDIRVESNLFKIAKALP